MTALDRASNGIWRCSNPAYLKRWLQEAPPTLVQRQVDAFLAFAYKHLGDPTSDERVWDKLGEAWISRGVRDALLTLSDGNTWREPPGTPTGGFGPVLRRVLPDTILVQGEAGFGPTPATAAQREPPRRVIALLTSRGAPPRVQELFGQLGVEIGKRRFKVVSAASGPAEQALLKGLGDAGARHARVLLGEGQKPPAQVTIRPTRLQDMAQLEKDAKAKLGEWFPAWRGDDEDRAVLERDLALLLSAQLVVAWSEEGQETGRLALPLLAAHQQGIPVMNVGASGFTLEKAIATLESWEEEG